MREIKFRGKRLDNGEWVYGFYVKYEHMGVIKYLIITDWAQVYSNSYYVIPETVGQFTGLLDKNGKDIYEGDIVAHNGILQKNKLLEIRFIDGAFCLYLNGIPDMARDNNAVTIRDAMFEAQNFRFGVKLILEVIGNIYENPELLEVSK